MNEEDETYLDKCSCQEFKVAVCECKSASEAHKLTHDQFKQKVHELIVDVVITRISPNEAVCEIVKLVNEVRW